MKRVLLIFGVVFSLILVGCVSAGVSPAPAPIVITTATPYVAPVSNTTSTSEYVSHMSGSTSRATAILTSADTHVNAFDMDGMASDGDDLTAWALSESAWLSSHDVAPCMAAVNSYWKRAVDKYGAAGIGVKKSATTLDSITIGATSQLLNEANALIAQASTAIKSIDISTCN